MFCGKCGNKIKPEQRYCNRCGNFLLNNNTNQCNNNQGRLDNFQRNINNQRQTNYNQNMINNNQRQTNYNQNMINNNQRQTNYNQNMINNNQGQTNYNQNMINNNQGQIKYNTNRYNNASNINTRRKKNNVIPIIVGIVSLFLIMVILLSSIVSIVLLSKGIDYYFDNDTTTSTEKTNGSILSKLNNKTAIITDNVYKGIKVNTIEDAQKLISDDSTNQKKSKDYSKEIIEIENDIISKYSITAVNLKEMDVEFAKELESVVGEIYREYPNARGYLTNLTLTNVSLLQGNGIIALFRPTFIFGTSNTKTTIPWVVKTQIQLNAKYFLDQDKLGYMAKYGSQSGYFPKNSTKYSPLAHEFGHYLSFIALLNHYDTDSIVLISENNQVENLNKIMSDFSKGDFSKQMLDEAYQNYVKDKGKIDFDKWRGQISEYAVTKDKSGNYIYDETIAEAFHDVYLNKNNANDASKYIVQVLKKYVEE